MTKAERDLLLALSRAVMVLLEMQGYMHTVERDGEFFAINGNDIAKKIHAIAGRVILEAERAERDGPL